ncbi:hypothetical protein [Methanococcus voltae]|uniref:Uncharacterized protein n=1 Tax=Methanococcus voltae (strain ATCC BAA-1334 / A3) TaxID=456320 RepID=D7DQN4_METV3|nr:hypothetical protein [Methanococcus voltae]MCS3901977.1 hypothetical protein [Methanococcus voltae]
MYINIFATLMSLCILMTFLGWDTGIAEAFEEAPSNMTIEKNLITTVYFNYIYAMDNYFNLDLKPEIHDDNFYRFFDQPDDEHGRGSRLRRIFRRDFN